jgi:hypothetical protein
LVILANNDYYAELSKVSYVQFEMFVMPLNTWMSLSPRMRLPQDNRLP